MAQERKAKNSKEGEEGSNPLSSAAGIRAELDRFESMLETLRVRYEQYFGGILALAPEKDHAAIKRMVRKLRGAPFKSSEINYRLRSLENRYNTYNTYWQRVLREREEGTYHKDVFRANLREKLADDERRAQTVAGAAERSLKALFDTYQKAIEQQSGKAQKLDFNVFRKNLTKRAKDLKAQTGAKRLSFKVVVHEGKVTLKAVVRDE